MLQQVEMLIPAMDGISGCVHKSWTEWQDWRADAAAHRAPLPGDWGGRLTKFQKLIIIRTLATVSHCNYTSIKVKHDFLKEPYRGAHRC